MFRFSIRDLLWIMLLVGFGVHSWMERAKALAKQQELRDALAMQGRLCKKPSNEHSV